MRTVASTLGLLAAFGAGCTGAAPLTQDQRVAIADTAASVVQKVFVAVNQMDSKALLDLYIPEPVIADNGVIYSTRDSYRAALDSGWAVIQGINSHTTSVRTLVAAPDVAVVMAPYVFTATAKSGRQVSGQGVLTALVQRQAAGGGWRIVRSHESEQHIDQLMEQLMSGKRRP